MQKPLKIVGLSPMAGYTDSPFRALIRELCPETYLVTELISADGLKYCSKNTAEMMNHFPNEKPLIVQLFGKHPDFFAEATKYAEKAGAAGIDINMGCPAKKVIHSGHGSALIQKPELAFEIVRATVAATKLPVSVKTRLGWTREDVSDEELTANLITFCKGIEAAGASMICIHGRTVKQGYAGIADWEPIYALKKALKIPVIGNGDITTPQDAVEKIRNLDGVFMGRGAIGKPWLLAQMHSAIHGLPILKDPDFDEIKRIAIRHAELAWEMKGRRGMLEMRKNLVQYLKGFSHVSEFRQQLVHVESVEDVKKVLEDYTKFLKRRKTLKIFDLSKHQ
jgi:tRNA-dihydrouridine synthase B